MVYLPPHRFWIMLTSIGLLLFCFWPGSHAQPQEQPQGNKKAELRRTVATASGSRVARPPQYVCLSFDGSGDPKFWEMTLEMARTFNEKYRSAGKSLHFTYFVSGIHFFPGRYRHQYRSYVYHKGRHQMKRGHAVIHFGGKEALIQQRIASLFRSLQEGHEIGSHIIGHFDGKGWTQFQWEEEFKQFNGVMWPVLKDRRMTDPLHWYSGPNLVSSLGILGFRAPFLSTSPGLWPVMKKHGLRYDASGIQKKHLWPSKNKVGIWRFLLAPLQISGSGKRTLSMDWNFFFAQTGGKIDRSPKRRNLYMRQTLDTYRRYFMHNYHGNRAPIHIGHHLVSLNGYGYWKAYRQFAQEVCSLPEVKCTTYKDLMNYMESLSPETIRAYQRQQFDQTKRPKKYFPRMF